MNAHVRKHSWQAPYSIIHHTTHQDCNPSNNSASFGNYFHISLSREKTSRLMTLSFLSCPNLLFYTPSHENPSKPWNTFIHHHMHPSPFSGSRSGSGSGSSFSPLFIPIPSQRPPLTPTPITRSRSIHTISMGIDGLQKWFRNTFPESCQDVPYGRHASFDHVCIDVNQILYVAANKSTSSQELVANLYRALNDYLKVCVPEKTVYIAVDGPAPKAKMVLQRIRRFDQVSADARKALFEDARAAPKKNGKGNKGTSVRARATATDSGTEQTQSHVHCQTQNHDSLTVDNAAAAAATTTATMTATDITSLQALVQQARTRASKLKSCRPHSSTTHENSLRAIPIDVHNQHLLAEFQISNRNYGEDDEQDHTDMNLDVAVDVADSRPNVGDGQTHHAPIHLYYVRQLQQLGNVPFPSQLQLHEDEKDDNEQDEKIFRASDRQGHVSSSRDPKQGPHRSYTPSDSNLSHKSYQSARAKAAPWDPSPTPIHSNLPSSSPQKLNSCAFTPGTEFMQQLDDAIYYFAATFVQKLRERNPKLQVIVSGSTVPGEGEVKIIKWINEYIAKQRRRQEDSGTEGDDDSEQDNEMDRDRNREKRFGSRVQARAHPPHLSESIVIIGGDGDIVLQGLSTSSVRDLYIFRKEDSKSNAAGILISCWQVVKHLNVLFPNQAFAVRNDLMLLCLMNGNDYLGRLRGISLTTAWDTYLALKRNDPQLLKQFLLDSEKKSFNWLFLRKFMVKLDQGFTNKRDQSIDASFVANLMIVTEISRVQSFERRIEELKSDCTHQGLVSLRNALETQKSLSRSIVRKFGILLKTSTDPHADEYDWKDAQRRIEMIPPTHQDPAVDYLINYKNDSSAYSSPEQWLKILLWTVQMYVDGHCSDYQITYDKPFSPCPQQLVRWIDSCPEQVLQEMQPSVRNNLPLVPLKFSIVLMPPNGASYVAKPLAHLLDETQTPIPQLLQKFNVYSSFDVDGLDKIIDSIPTSKFSYAERRLMKFGETLLFRQRDHKQDTEGSYYDVVSPDLQRYPPVNDKVVINLALYENYESGLLSSWVNRKNNALFSKLPLIHFPFARGKGRKSSKRLKKKDGGGDETGKIVKLTKKKEITREIEKMTTKEESMMIETVQDMEKYDQEANLRVKRA